MLLNLFPRKLKLLFIQCVLLCLLMSCLFSIAALQTKEGRWHCHLKYIEHNLFSSFSRGQYGSPYNHSFVIVIPSHCCKETYRGLLYATTETKAVLLYVFKIIFPASLLIYFFFSSPYHVWVAIQHTRLSPACQCFYLKEKNILQKL